MCGDTDIGLSIVHNTYLSDGQLRRQLTTIIDLSLGPTGMTISNKSLNSTKKFNIKYN